MVVQSCQQNMKKPKCKKSVSLGFVKSDEGPNRRNKPKEGGKICYKVVINVRKQKEGDCHCQCSRNLNGKSGKFSNVDVPREKKAEERKCQTENKHSCHGDWFCRIVLSVYCILILNEDSPFNKHPMLRGAFG